MDKSNMDDSNMDDSNMDDSKMEKSNKDQPPRKGKLSADESVVIEEAETDLFNYAKSYVLAYNCFKVLAVIFFQFPFKCEMTKDGRYEFSWSVFQGFFFFLLSLTTYIAGIGFTINTVSLCLNYPNQTATHSAVDVTGGTNVWHARAEEMLIFYRNSSVVIMFPMLILPICVSTYKTMKKRTYIQSYLTYCGNALNLMKLDAALGVPKLVIFLIVEVVIFTGCAVAIIAFRLSPAPSGAPGLLGHLFVRAAIPDAYQKEDLYYILRLTAQVALVYYLVASKVFLILFVFQCKVIKGAIRLWNDRLDRVLNKKDTNEDNEEAGIEIEISKENRTDNRELLEDHTIILDLISGADLLFADVIESYYMSEGISLTFILYWLWQAFVGEEFTEATHKRKLDIIFIIVILLHDLFYFTLTCTSASGVSDEGIEGLEIIRTKGVIGRQNPEELYLLMSLYVSYAGHYDIAISGGGYSYIDQKFLVGLVGSILSYFIVLIQFSHPFGFSKGEELDKLVGSKRIPFLKTMEDVANLTGDFF